MSEDRYRWTGAVGGPALRELDPMMPRAALAAVLRGDRPLSGSCAALELLLHAAHEWGDEQARGRAAIELGEMTRGQDPRSGSFSSDLASHARRTRLLWDGFALLRDPRLVEAAGRATAHLLREKLDAVPAEPAAQAALALLRASAFQPDPRARQAAASLLVLLQAKLFDPGRGMASGRLGDNAWAALAFTESFLMNGRKQDREFADALMRHLFQDLWHKDSGGFMERAPEPGGPPCETLPFEENAVALEALWRLHHLKGNANYKKWVDWGLRAVAAGCADPALARVQDISARGRLELELVGRPGEARADALLAALHARYLPRKIVSFVDPDDQDYILAHKLEAAGYPCLFGCLQHKPAASAGEPSQVGAVLAALERPA